MRDPVQAIVFGAGVAGLTAAHELAERGLRVWVVEEARDGNRHGEWGMAIGGMARTQYVEVTSGQPGTHMLSARPQLNGIVVEMYRDDSWKPAHPEDWMQYLRSLPYDAKLECLFPNGKEKRKAIQSLLDELKRGGERQLKETPLKVQGKKKRKSVVLVRRPRCVSVDLCGSGWTGGVAQDSQFKFGAFLDGLDAGDTVTLLTAPSVFSGSLGGEVKNVAWLNIWNDLIARGVVVDQIVNDADMGKRIEITTEGRTVSIGIDDYKLTTEGYSDLDRFIKLLASGDVVEVHTSGPGAAATKRQWPTSVEAANAMVVSTLVDAGDLHEGLRYISARLDKAGVAVIPVDDSRTDWFWFAVQPDRGSRSEWHVVPGEHGFRFFPAYYRHLRSTLGRIPVFEDDGRVRPRLTNTLSGRTVLDNLINTPTQAIAGASVSPLTYPRRRQNVALALRQLHDLLVERGYDLRDIGQFVLRLGRYMVTGSKRRASELEDISWWDYLQGRNGPNSGCCYRYSEVFKRDIVESPRVLAAFDAEWGDARTNGSTFVQLLLNQFTDGGDVDQVLNAPTNEAWLEHWQKYLEDRLRVVFVPARLDGVEWSEERCVPRVVPVGPVRGDHFAQLRAAITDSESPAYFVLATDAVSAEALFKDCPRAMRVGVASDLQRFTTDVRVSSGSEGISTRARTSQIYGETPEDRFQTLTGIQFYFRDVVRLFDGHVYYMGTPWALSSVAQHQFWRTRPSGRQEVYRSVLSVDIGRFEEEAWRLTPNEIAKEVWKQIADSLNDYWGDQALRVKPDWFSLDRGILLKKAEHRARNSYPYLIPIVGDWSSRPGPDPWDPGRGHKKTAQRRLQPGLWQAPWGGYCVHWGQWVFAGTYLRHFTRMTTMEAANESARHAVNAILDHLGERLAGDESVSVGGSDWEPRTRYHGVGNPLDPHAAYVPSACGDYCHIWNMEEYELPELSWFRELDDQLFEQGDVHIWDRLGVEVVPSLLSRFPSSETR